MKNIIDKNEPIRGTSEQGRKSTITKIFNKVARFIYEVEEGDIIITPAENSEKISIGVVTSDLIETVGYAEKYLTQNPDTELTPCPYVKRRNVHWLKHLSKYQLDIYLQRALHSQEAMTRLDDQAQYINRNLYDAYIIGDVFHGIFQTLTDDEHTLSQIAELFSVLDENIRAVIDTHNLNITTKDIKIKINAHSPIMIDLSLVSECITSLAPYIIPAIAGGGVVGTAISAYGEYRKNQTTQESETERKKLEENTKDKANKRNTALEAWKLRSALATEEEKNEFDKFAEKAGLYDE